jgi:phage tail protein X
MKPTVAATNQTLFDLALQSLGAVEGVWDLIDANPGLALDMSVPAGFRVMAPDKAINARVVDYYSRNAICPVSGLDEEVTLTFNDMNTIAQILDYDLAGGSKEFNKVWLEFLNDTLAVQVVYEGITANDVVASVDFSLDGENFAPIPPPFESKVLDNTNPTHIWLIVGLEATQVRLHITVPNTSAGIIKSVTWKT